MAQPQWQVVLWFALTIVVSFVTLLGVAWLAGIIRFTSGP